MHFTFSTRLLSILYAVTLMYAEPVISQNSKNENLHISKESSVAGIKRYLDRFADSVKTIVILSKNDSAIKILDAYRFKILECVNIYEIDLQQVPKFVFLN